jgi:hypothetical protein
VKRKASARMCFQPANGARPTLEARRIRQIDRDLTLVGYGRKRKVCPRSSFSWRAGRQANVKQKVPEDSETFCCWL